MTVYLLHLNQPLPRGVNSSGTALEAGHYIGYTDDLLRRILEHAEGHGARFMQVCHERQIDFALARTWEGKGADRSFERRLKNYKKAHLLCPICDPDALGRMRLENLMYWNIFSANKTIDRIITGKQRTAYHDSQTDLSALAQA